MLSTPYEMPAHAITEGAAFGVADVADSLLELSAWFANAEFSLVRVQRQTIERKLAASDVRCWPHHFDLATLASFPARDATGYIGAGLSPGDKYYDEPYFYVSVYPGRTLRHCRACRSSVIGTRTSSRRPLRRLIRLLQP